VRGVWDSVMVSSWFGSVCGPHAIILLPSPCTTLAGFVGNAEISVLFAARRVLQRHIDGGWYPGFLFPVAHILWAIPRAMLECLLFVSTIYFMLGLRASAGAFFTQMAIVLMAQLSTSAWLRLVAFSTPTIELANT